MPGYRKLGRPTAHRKSMLRNLVTDLFREGRIQTTDCRAKEARREAEKLITLAKRGDLHARRQVLAYVFDEDGSIYRDQYCLDKHREYLMENGGIAPKKAIN